MAMNAWILVAIEIFKEKEAGRLDKCLINLKEAGVPPHTIQRACFAVENYEFCTLKDFSSKAREFINIYIGEKKRAVLAGKNVGNFDMQFLPENLRKRCLHNTIDPGSMFIDWGNDNKPPCSNDVMRRAKVEHGVDHDAYHDNLDMISAIRYYQLQQEMFKTLQEGIDILEEATRGNNKSE
jgi:oligoribonuclease (3'-5' exoribonuclease)